MAKIVVLGNSGSGKSSLTASLAKKLNIEYLHLDKIVYKESWDKPCYEDLKEEVSKMIDKQSWIMDGNFLYNCQERFEKCDTIYFLDINRFVCLRSVLKRNKKYKGKKRESRSDLCDERITRSYLKWVFFDFYKTSRKIILKMIKEYNDKNVVIFKNRKQINKFLMEE
jgi:adenylate kinase family enzyme